jgi:hypothetical protein
MLVAVFFFVRLIKTKKDQEKPSKSGFFSYWLGEIFGSSDNEFPH